MTSLTDYICINHHLMTIKEMAAEAGVSDGKIRYIMEQKGWKVFSPVDRTREYIQAHPGAILEDIAEHLDIQVNYTQRIARELGIELMTRSQASRAGNQKPVNYSLMHRAFNDSDPEGVEEDLRILFKEPGKVKRVREAYSQSGSPFGLADQVFNRKLK